MSPHPIDPTAQAALANRLILVEKAVTAFAANQTFLALSAPTQAQAVAQVQALTRQVNALIRVVGEQLTDTSGT